MIPDAIVDTVRDRADIVEVVGEHLPLKRAGKEFKALCPFHQEKTPSFYVVPAKGFYKCFGCGEGGDVFSFLMKRLGLNFQDAVRHVAERVGVDIPLAAAVQREEETHKAVYEAVAFAADFFRRTLWDAAGEPARRYLEARGIDRAAAERFQLGYAPDEWRALREAAGRHGIGDTVLLEAGLIKESERADEPYDRQRDRLIFPILDGRGRVVAFGGRVLSKAHEGTPKYLNSPDTPIYQKGRILYGLAWAKAAIRREEAALVVEGYMDYVSLAARGIENVVAGLGTAMTTEQAELLSRYTERALLLYDSDAAGLRATFRTADALLREGVHPLVVTLPQGEDPDSLARSGGAAALRPFLDGAVDVLDRKLQILAERGYFDDIEGVRKAIDGLLPTLRAVTDPALHDIYIARVAERTGVRRETLEREAASARRAEAAPAPREVRADERRGEASPGRAAEAARPGLAGQRKLLLLLLRDEARIPQAREALEPGELGDAVYREIFEELVRTGGLHGQGPTALRLSEPAQARIEGLLGDPEELSEGDRTFEDAVSDIRSEGINARMDELDDLIRLADARGDEHLATSLTSEKAELARRLSPTTGHNLERRGRKTRRSGPSTKNR